MKSVGKAALAMVEEVRRQFATISGLMEGTARPDYRRCVEISTAVSPKFTHAQLFIVRVQTLDFCICSRVLTLLPDISHHLLLTVCTLCC